jgi:hypothetical protein
VAGLTQANARCFGECWRTPPSVMSYQKVSRLVGAEVIAVSAGDISNHWTIKFFANYPSNIIGTEYFYVAILE